MTTIGSSTIAVPLSPASPNVTLTGTIDAYGPAHAGGAAAVYGPSATTFTLTNLGLIETAPAAATSITTGIVLGQLGTIINSGSIIDASGLAMFGTAANGYIENTGLIKGTTSNAVQVAVSSGESLNSSATIVNSGTIINANGGFGVEFKYAEADIQNTGTIAGALGAIYLAYKTSGSISNAGTITSSEGDGIFVSVGTAAITNTGFLEGSLGGINLVGAGFISNSSAGTIISGTSLGAMGLELTPAPFSLAPSTIINAGLVEGFYGMFFNGVTTLQNSGTIIGVGAGIVMSGTSAYASSSGLIEATGTAPFQTEPPEIAAVVLKSGTFDNSGQILASNLNGISADSTTLSTVINATSGTVNAANVGVAQAFPPPYLGGAGTLYLDNYGQILAGTYGVTLTNGTVSNAGIISATNAGILAISHGSYTKIVAIDNTKSGLITGRVGISLQDGGQIENGGDIVGSINAINISSSTAVAYINNTGAIYARSGVAIETSVSNPTNAITLINAGFVGSKSSVALQLYASTVSILNTGEIYSQRSSAAYVGGTVNLTNSGLIAGGADGIDIVGAGTIDNTAKGTINGLGTYGVGIGAGRLLPDRLPSLPYHLPDIFLNQGLIQARFGVALYGEDTLQNSGTIIGSSTGAGAFTSAATIINTGLIESTGEVANPTPDQQSGIYGGSGVYNAGTISATNAAAIKSRTFSDIDITNTSAGLILSNLSAIVVPTGTLNLFNAGDILAGSIGIDLASGTIENDGLISVSSGPAITFAAAGTASGLLIIGASSTIDGQIDLAGNALEIAAGGDRPAKISAAQYKDIGTLSVNSEATVVIKGSLQLAAHTITISGRSKTIAASLSNKGYITIGDGAELTIDGVVTGTGTIKFDDDLTLKSNVGTGQAIDFSGTHTTLTLDDASTFRAHIGGFKTNETIDLANIPLTHITATAFSNGILTLKETSGYLTLTFANPSTFSNDIFLLTADGAGTAITLEHSAPSIITPATSARLIAPAAELTIPTPIFSVIAPSAPSPTFAPSTALIPQLTTPHALPPLITLNP